MASALCVIFLSQIWSGGSLLYNALLLAPNPNTPETLNTSIVKKIKNDNFLF
jgi:hypothetical protein